MDMSGSFDDITSAQCAPPPQYYPEQGAASATCTRYALYHCSSAGSSAVHASAAAAHYLLYDDRFRKLTYSIRVPKKREGWKAEVFSISEKQREELRYEVRREPLSRKFDFRPPNGVHNVMLPSSSFQAGHKSYTLEAADGQKLVWRRHQQNSGMTASLISLPSNTLLARYTLSNDGRTGRAPTIAYASMDAELQGLLEITQLEQTLGQPAILHRQASVHSTSSSSSEGRPRLPRAYRTPSIGFCAPAIIAGAVASPLSSAAMNRFCILGDDLSNLGRTVIQPSGTTSVAREDTTEQAKYWAEQNRTVRKNIDPRARPVDMDLLLASLIAVVAG